MPTRNALRSQWYHLLSFFSKAPSYLDRIANGTTRAMMNTGLSSITRDDTWIYLSFAFELVSNKLGYC